jgi:protein TonB
MGFFKKKPADKEEDMNYQIRAIQLSLAVHAVAIVLLIVAGNPLVSDNKLLVVDFTLLDAVDTSGSHNGSVVTIGKQEIKAGDTRIKKQRKVAVPEPEMSVPIKQEALPAKEEAQVSPVAAPAPIVAYGGENIEAENRGTQDTGSMFSARDNAGLSGGTIRGHSAGNFGDALGAGMGYLKDFSYIKEIIKRNTVYPEIARKMVWEGKVIVSFFISSDGFVKDIKIRKSSGIEVLDRNAVETVKKASPFPRPPAAAQLTIPVSYKLH